MKKIFFCLFLSSLTLSAENTTIVNVSITIGDQKTTQSNYQKEEDTYSYLDPAKKSLQILACSAAGMTAYNFYKTCQKHYDVIKKYLVYMGMIASCGYMITKYPGIFKPSAGTPPSLPPSPPSPVIPVTPHNAMQDVVPQAPDIASIWHNYYDVVPLLLGLAAVIYNAQTNQKIPIEA